MSLKNIRHLKPILLTKTEDVEKICNKLTHESFITIDTEFVREKTYWPSLCLVQLAGKEDVVLIDTCAKNIDLSALGKLLSDEKCIKVFHAAYQDIEIFYHIFKKIPVNIFDTQIAAMAVGLGNQVGYSTIVYNLTGEKIDKSYRVSNWAKRPLSVPQISYAASDVTYLRIVYEKLYKMLKEKNRFSWLHEEQAIYEKEENFFINPLDRWKKIKIKTSNRKVLGVLKKLAAWREEEAMKCNVPRQRIIRDESLIDMAVSSPQTKKQLQNIRNINPALLTGEKANYLLKIIKEGWQEPIEKVIHKKETISPDASILTSLLKILLIRCCEQYHVSPRLVASTEDLEKCAQGDQTVGLFSGWRKDVFGDKAKDLLDGKIFLSVSKGTLKITDSS